MNLLANGVAELLRFADYRGRSTRTDLAAFWLITLVTGGALLGATTILEIAVFRNSSLTTSVQLSCQWLFAIPMIALFVRRMHDRRLPGWWVALSAPAAVQNVVADYYRLTTDFEAMFAVKTSTLHLLSAIPLLAVFIVLLLPGEDGANRYGPNPRFNPPGEPA